MRIEVADLQGADFDLGVLAFDEAVSVRGAIYRLGDHRLMCGDSAAPGDLDKLLAGQPIHLANTDPPQSPPETQHTDTKTDRLNKHLQA